MIPMGTVAPGTAPGRQLRRRYAGAARKSNCSTTRTAARSTTGGSRPVLDQRRDLLPCRDRHLPLGQRPRSFTCGYARAPQRHRRRSRAVRCEGSTGYGRGIGELGSDERRGKPGPYRRRVRNGGLPTEHLVTNVESGGLGFARPGWARPAVETPTSPSSASTVADHSDDLAPADDHPAR